MFSVYTRHYPPCPRTDIHYRRCRCPKWIRGAFEAGGARRLASRSRRHSIASNPPIRYEALSMVPENWIPLIPFTWTTIRKFSRNQPHYRGCCHATEIPNCFQRTLHVPIPSLAVILSSSCGYRKHNWFRPHLHRQSS